MSRSKEMFSTPVHDTCNKEGYPAYTRSLEERYLQTLLTNTIGNTYYANSYELLKDADDIHDEMLKKDPVFVSKALKYARQEGYMRLQPIFGLAKLSSVDTTLFKSTFSDVVRIPSDLQDFMTIIGGLGRGQGGRAIKDTVGKWLNDNLTEYWAIKYNGRGRGYSLGDIIKTVHPKPNNDKTSLMYKYLIKKADLEELEVLPQIYAYEQLKRTNVLEEQSFLIEKGRLPHDVVTGATKMSPELWNSLLKDMPVFATLRNLNTFDREGILDSNKDLIVSRLNNKDVLKSSKILPFRFLNAFNNVNSTWVKDMLRQSVELTFDNLPDIPGKTAVLLDISGSMRWTEAFLTSAVFAFALYKKTNGNGLLWSFNTVVFDEKPSLYDSILSQAERIRPRGGTNTSAPVEKLIRENKKVDNIIMITDQQQNDGSLFYSSLKHYRSKVNRDVKTFVIDISPYQKAMIPDLDKNTFYIYGWSDQVLQFISQSIDGYGSMIEKISEM